MIGFEGQDVIGLVPAAGSARRLGSIETSKEIVPLIWGDHRRPRPVAESLLEALSESGVSEAIVIIAPGKDDIRETLGDGRHLGLTLSYRVIEDSGSILETLDSAYPDCRNRTVAFGFPDVIYEPVRVFRDLLERWSSRSTDVLLALFPTDRPEKADMVEVGPDGGVRRILIKPATTDLELTWLAAVWSPSFTNFLHANLRDMSGDQDRELYPGDVFNAALDGGMKIECVRFEDGRHLDIGTPGDLERARRRRGVG